MTIDEAVRYFGNRNRICSALGLASGYVYGWRGPYVPLRWQMALSAASNGALTADKKSLIIGVRDKCVLPYCNRPQKARGFCNNHYRSFRSYSIASGTWDGSRKTGIASAAEYEHFPFYKAHIRFRGLTTAQRAAELGICPQALTFRLRKHGSDVCPPRKRLTDEQRIASIKRWKELARKREAARSLDPKVKNKKRARDHHRAIKESGTLDDQYIKRVIYKQVKKMGITIRLSDIPAELIESRRAYLKIVRHLREDRK